MTVIQDGPDSPNAADGWHTDATWLAEPPAYALLHMETPPEVGGDTMWCSATAAYDQLAADAGTAVFPAGDPRQRELHPRRLRKGRRCGPKIADGLREHYLPVEHPMVRTHPETGRRSIVFAWRFMNRIVGFSEHESKSLLTFIGEWVKEPRFHVRWQWEQGDLAIWDERSTLHRASADTGRRSGLSVDSRSMATGRSSTQMSSRSSPRSSSRSRTESAQPIAAGRLWRREGIRTPGPVKARWFQDQCNRPLCHPSGDEATASRTAKPHSSVATSMRLWCQSRAAMRAVPAIGELSGREGVGRIAGDADPEGQARMVLCEVEAQPFHRRDRAAFRRVLQHHTEAPILQMGQRVGLTKRCAKGLRDQYRFSVGPRSPS